MLSIINRLEGLSVVLHNGLIIAEITKRAKAKFPRMPEDYPLTYQDYWLATGKLWASELRAEGSIATAETVEKHVKWFEENLK